MKNNNEEDEVENLFNMWRENLQFSDDQILKQHAETLVNDITKFSFDITSDYTKYKDYGMKFVEMMMKSQLNDAIKLVDVYVIDMKVIQQSVSAQNLENCERIAFEALLFNTSSAGKTFYNDKMKINCNNF